MTCCRIMLMRMKFLSPSFVGPDPYFSNLSDKLQHIPAQQISQKVAIHPKIYTMSVSIDDGINNWTF